VDGSNVLGNANLDANGQATFAISTLAPGSHVIKAVYGGNPDFVFSTSDALNQIVNKDSTTTTLTSSSNPSVLGQSITFTATVAVSRRGQPHRAALSLSSMARLRSARARSPPRAVVTLTTSTLSVGTHTITVTYAGDASDLASTSAPSARS